VETPTKDVYCASYSLIHDSEHTALKPNNDTKNIVHRRNIDKFDWSKYGGESAKRRIRTKAKEQSVDLYKLFQENDLEKDIVWR
jgi:hypothetical protein